MPFNAGGQTYIGGQLLAQGLGNFGQGIGGGIMQALEEQRKKQQFTDQIMLQALESGHATPEQYLEYSKKNTKGKQDYAMTVAANFADDYKQRVKEQHEKITADIAQSNAASAASKAQTAHFGQLADIANQALSDPGPTPEEELKRNRFGAYTVWVPGKGWEVRDMTGSGAGKAPSPYANTPVWSQDGKRVIGEHDASGTPHYYPEAELNKMDAEGTNTITTQGVPDPFRPGKFLPDKIMVIGPGKKSSVEEYNTSEGSPYFVDPETGVLTYKKSRKAVEGSAVQAAVLAKRLGFGPGGDTNTSSGGAQAGDAGSGVPSALGNIINGLKSVDAMGIPIPTATPTGTPLDQIIQQISPTPTPTQTPNPAATPAAEPTGTPLDQILQQLLPTPSPGPGQIAPGGQSNLLDDILKQIVSAGSGGGKRPLDKATATQLLIEAGGDKAKARKLAKDRGYDVK